METAKNRVQVTGTLAGISYLGLEERNTWGMDLQWGEIDKSIIN